MLAACLVSSAEVAAADEKRLAAGGDLLVTVPIGPLADISGALIGPVARAGFRAVPHLELGLRAGFLFALGKDTDVPAGAHGANAFSDTTGVRVLPIWLGARWFFLDETSGPYASGGLGANVLMPFASGPRFDIEQLAGFRQDTTVRLGFDVGAGSVVPRLPIHAGVQLTFFDVAPQDEREKTLWGLTFAVGYELGLL